MKFRYTFRKNWLNRTVYMTSDSMEFYKDRFSNDKGYTTVKREMFRDGKWEEMI